MLKKNTLLPDIELKDENGDLVSLHDHISKDNLVVYFYPKDDTPGCTAEACSFRDSFEEFKDHGAVVYGVSADSPASHKKFKERHRLNFSLLSDPKREAEKAFKVPRNLFGLLPGRVTFVFNKEGILVHSFESALNATKHIKESLKALKNI